MTVIFADFVKRCNFTKSKFNSDAMNRNHKRVVILSLVKAEIRPCESFVLMFVLVQMSPTVFLSACVKDHYFI